MVEKTRLFQSKHEKETKGVAKTGNLWKSAKKEVWTLSSNRNDEVSFRSNICENKEERSLPEGGRWRI